MNTADQDARQTLINITKALLEEQNDIESITVRLIAERAGVGTGLINYHFKSKDNLLSIAIGDVMAEAIRSFTSAGMNAELDPVAKLKRLLKELFLIICRNKKLMRFILSQEIMEGNLKTALYLIPLLKEIFGTQKNDMELRIIALQIIHPIQVTGLNIEAFYMFSGIDLNDEEQRNTFIDTLINNLVNPVLKGR